MMAAHAEWFDTQFVTIVAPGWTAGDGTVDDHAIVVGFDNYAVVEGSLDQLDDFADRIKARIEERRAELAAGFIVVGDDPVHEVDVLYWSNELGWIEDSDDATVFTRSERDEFNLPLGTDVRWAPKAAVLTIANLHDLAGWLGEEEPRLFNRRLFKDTECGASISLHFDWRDPLHNGAPGWESITLDEPHGIVGFTIQTIVEGSDAEINSALFRFPVSVAEVEAFVGEMETEAAALWHETNDEVTDDEHVHEGGGDFCNTCGERLS